MVLATFDASLELHPMLVHFPIALLMVSFVLDAAGYVMKREALHRAGFMTLIPGVVGVALALATGLLTPEAGEKGIGIHTSGGLSGFFSGDNVRVHQNLAYLLLAVSLAWLLLRLSLWRRLRTVNAAYLGLGLIVLGVLALTGYYGGEIVYGPKVTVSHLSDTKFDSVSNGN